MSSFRRHSVLALCLLALAGASCSGQRLPQGGPDIVVSLAPTRPPALSASLTPTVSPTVSSSPTSTLVPVTAPPTATPLLTTTPLLTETPLPTRGPLPGEYYITGIFGHKQYFSLGCEAGVATDWAAYFGVQINEFAFQYELPLSDNPDKGFVGDVNGPWGQTPPYAYGVHAGPVAALLRNYGLPAQAYKQMTLEQLKSELAEGHPIIAWVIGNVVGGLPAEYTDAAGDTTIVAAYEHVVLVTGYNEKSLRYNSNGKFYDVPFDVFENSWGVLGNMAIIYEEETPVEK